ncbi:hypothetical protein NEOLEDRAFT_586182 [Neolentinus lepideus HHB14362 ss-1]|uniref:Uncharacterized protein n=1 Tax=Neolentinus lepideus HHB14362 ss-1 TaxID=1314782 RepID=A0A165V726_9AGAM|nr:hypothetical protein NEOLEDRAFT_586182 [Neolentinus lepideus HHB14362 ss-1]
MLANDDQPSQSASVDKGKARDLQNNSDKDIKPVDVIESENRTSHSNGISNGLSRIPRLFIQSKAPSSNSQGKGESYAPATLARYGIKVRDFAYESKLPPLPSIRLPPQPPSQVDGGPRLLKRARRDWDEEAPFWGGPSHGFPNHSAPPAQQGSNHKKAKPLERTPTELIETAQKDHATAMDVGGSPSGKANAKVAVSQPRREFVVDLSDYSSSQEPSSQSQDVEDCGINGNAKPLQGAPTLPNLHIPVSSARDRTPVMSSEDSEPYIVTPIVTPNGSLQFTDTDAAALQTGRPSGSRVETDDMDVSSVEGPSMSSQKDERNEKLHSSSSPMSPPSISGPLSDTTPNIRSENPFPLAPSSPFITGVRGRARNISTESSTAISGDAEPQRYFLRQRPDSRSPAPPAPSTARSRSKRRGVTPSAPMTTRTRSIRRTATPPRRRPATRPGAPTSANAGKSKEAPKTRRSNENRSTGR